MKNTRLFTLVLFVTLLSCAPLPAKPRKVAHVASAPAPVVLTAEERRELLESIQADAHVAEAQDAAATADDAKEKQNLVDAHTDLLKAQAAEVDAKAEAARLGNAAASAKAGRKAAVAAEAKEKARADAEAKAKHHAWELLAVVVIVFLVLLGLLGAQLQTLLDAIAKDAFHAGEAVGGEALEAVEKIGWVAKVFACVAAFV